MCVRWKRLVTVSRCVRALEASGYCLSKRLVIVYRLTSASGYCLSSHQRLVRLSLILLGRLCGCVESFWLFSLWPTKHTGNMRIQSRNGNMCTLWGKCRCIALPKYIYICCNYTDQSNTAVLPNNNFLCLIYIVSLFRNIYFFSLSFTCIFIYFQFSMVWRAL